MSTKRRAAVTWGSGVMAAGREVQLDHLLRWAGAGQGRFDPFATMLSSKISVKPLITEAQLQQRVLELAAQISSDYANKNPLLVGVLNGSFIFLADLLRRLTIPVTTDFIAVSSYGSSTQSSGVVRILKDLEQPIEGQDVLLVEDIVDTGLTLNYILQLLKSRNPRSVSTCVLLDKVSKRLVPVTINYRGFEVPDVFVVGYGLDYDGRFRELPAIYALEASDAQT